MKVLVTGTNKGLGAGICSAFRSRGVEVVSLNRNPSDEHSGAEYIADFANLADLEGIVQTLADHHPDIDAVFLNAGALGPLGITSTIQREDLDRVIRINFSANKVIVDALIKTKNAKSFIQISSGASERVYEKWAAYGLSKMLLRRLFDFYRVEHPERSFIVVNPGPLATVMNAKIRAQSNLNVEWMSKFENSSNLSSPKVVSSRLVELFLVGGLPSSDHLIDLRG
jgi:NAD(P)-dependent dehydrogenase (short-subunit alcohol dehydrogenase family)